MEAVGAVADIERRRADEGRCRQRQLQLYIRTLRDIANPFEMSDKSFRNLFRLPKYLARELIRILYPRLIGVRNTKIRPHIQVLCTLRFLASGEYQLRLAQHHNHPSSEPSVSTIIFMQILSQVASTLEALAPYFIRFPQTRIQRMNISNGFLRHNWIQRILGIIDCFVVKLIRPAENEEAFFHYRHGPSLNVQVICDYRHVIQNIRVCPGSSNDQHIWNHSNIKDYLERLRMDPAVAREGRYYLLGDSGYALSPILIIPILEAEENTPEFNFTTNHLQTRCQVEQTFGIFTNIFQCISRRRVLHYTPARASTFIMAVAVLHNFRQLNGLAFPNNEPDILLNNENVRYDESHNSGVRERNNIVHMFYN